MAEKRENNEEFENCQSSQLEEEHLQKLEADSVPENTKKQALLGFEEVYSVARERKNKL